MPINQTEPSVSGIDTSANSATMIVRPVVLADTSDNPFGTSSNPIATNQFVGTVVYQTTTMLAAASGNVTLPAAVGKTTYLNGFYVSVAHTASSTVAGQVTVSLDGGTTTHMNYLIAVSSTYPGLVQVDFPDPIPATAANTGIKVTSPALTGAGIGSITAFGYQL